MKKKWIYLIPLLLAFVLVTVHFEVVAKYRTKNRFTLPELSVRLFSNTFNVPTVSGELVYDGTPKAPVISGGEGLEMEGELQATGAGSYSIIVTLPDPVNDRWADGTSGPKEIVWTIQKRRIAKPTVSDGTRIFTGESQGPTVSPYETDYVAASGLSESEAGEYEAVFSLKDTENTVWEDGTTASLRKAWGVYVCRIGDVYYHSVTRAFQTDTSSASLPVTMLCNWEENCVNASGADALFLDGYTLSSHGVTVKNLSELEVSGPGVILASCDDQNSLAPLENTGTLTVTSGVFRTQYSGESTGPNEAYGVLNQDGTTVINGGTFEIQGGGLAAEPLCANGGEIIVEGGVFSAVNQAATHGAYGGWIEGGSITVRGGIFYAENQNGFAVAFDGVAGQLTVEDTDAEIVSTKNKNGICIHTQGSLKADIRGGTFRLTGEGSSSILQASGSSELSVSGGTFTARDTVPSESFTRGFYANGGKIYVEEGAFSAYSSGGIGASGVTVSAGEVILSGGELTVQAALDAECYGVYAEGGSVTENGMKLTCVSDLGHVTGLYCPKSDAVLQAVGGSVTMAGKTICIGTSTAPTHKITLPADTTGMPFTVYYQNYFQTGSYWSGTPYVIATQIAALPEEYAAPAEKKSFSAAKSAGKKSGRFLLSGENFLIGGPNEPWLSVSQMQKGFWSVTAENDAEQQKLILQAEMMPEEDAALLPGEERTVSCPPDATCLVLGTQEFFCSLTLGVSETPLYGFLENEGRSALTVKGQVIPWPADSGRLIVRQYTDENGIVFKVELIPSSENGMPQEEPGEFPN